MDDSTVLLKNFKLDDSSEIPLYEQLMTFLRMHIRSGQLPAGTKLPTETFLCDSLGISRTTIRQCMNRLVAEGLIVRRRGQGSFVADKKIHRTINNTMYNFTESMREVGAVPSSLVLEKGVVLAPNDIADIMQLAEGTQMFRLKRLRYANGQPLILETTYVPYYLCSGIEYVNFETSSLYHVLTTHYDLRPYHAVETIAAIIIPHNAAHHLECGTLVPGYSINRLSYLDTNTVFEYTTSITRADKCVFQLDLYNSQSKNVVDFERKLQL